MSAEISIKQVSSDTDRILASDIRKQVFVHEQGIPAAVEEDGLNETAIHVLLFAEGQAVATARLNIADDNEAVIARVAVLERFRGQGHGGVLVRELERIAVDKKVKRLLLRPHHYLERFYTDLGYATVAGETEMAGEHQLITMEKILT